MKVFFVGVGEACDPEHGNTSVHIQTENNTRILCDCGFSAAHSYFASFADPDSLDMVWISHFHGDHFFGMPLLLLRFWEMKRSKALVIAGQQGLEGRIRSAMDLAYPGFWKRLCYEVCFQEIEPEKTHRILEVGFESIPTDHSQRNLGLLVKDGPKKLYYSGDGRPTKDVEYLIRDCDLAVHEAFLLEAEIHHHGSVYGCLNLAEAANVKQLALVHMERNCRRNKADEIKKFLQDNPVLRLPVAGDLISL